MTHSDDKGLVLPPKLAPIQVVIVPIHKTDEQLDAISQKVDELTAELRKKGISVKYDKRTTYKPGWKFAEYELKGVPLRIALGPRDLENGTLEIARRDILDKKTISIDETVSYVEKTLKEIQENLFNRSVNYRDAHITEVNSFDEFKEVLESKGGFVSAHWDGTSETEEQIKNLTKATIRCIPNDAEKEDGICVFSGSKSERRVLFAKAY